MAPSPTPGSQGLPTAPFLRVGGRSCRAGIWISSKRGAESAQSYSDHSTRNESAAAEDLHVALTAQRLTSRRACDYDCLEPLDSHPERNGHNRGQESGHTSKHRTHEVGIPTPKTNQPRVTRSHTYDIYARMVCMPVSKLESGPTASRTPTSPKKHTGVMGICTHSERAAA